MFGLIAELTRLLPREVWASYLAIEGPHLRLKIARALDPETVDALRGRPWIQDVRLNRRDREDLELDIEAKAPAPGVEFNPNPLRPPPTSGPEGIEEELLPYPDSSKAMSEIHLRIQDMAERSGVKLIQLQMEPEFELSSHFARIGLGMRLTGPTKAWLAFLQELEQLRPGLGVIELTVRLRPGASLAETAIRIRVAGILKKSIFTNPVEGFRFPPLSGLGVLPSVEEVAGRDLFSPERKPSAEPALAPAPPPHR